MADLLNRPTIKIIHTVNVEESTKSSKLFINVKSILQASSEWDYELLFVVTKTVVSRLDKNYVEGSYQRVRILINDKPSIKWNELVHAKNMLITLGTQ